jgi:hypothetical protein
MRLLRLCGLLFLAQAVEGGTLRIRGQIHPDAAEYIQAAPPGELSPDLRIRVQGPGEASYSPCWPVKGALCEAYVDNGSGKAKILIEAEGYEPVAADVPRLTYSGRGVTSYDIGTIRLKEAARPRLVQVLAGDATGGRHRWKLILRNPALEPFAIRQISLAGKNPRLFRRVCDSRWSESYAFRLELRAAESTVEGSGYLRIYNCGDEMLDLKAPAEISIPGELMTTIQLEIPAAFGMERPGVAAEPGNRPAEPLEVEARLWESFVFQLTAVRTDGSGGGSITEELRHEFVNPQVRERKRRFELRPRQSKK